MDIGLPFVTCTLICMQNTIFGPTVLRFFFDFTPGQGRILFRIAVVHTVNDEYKHSETKIYRSKNRHAVANALHP